MLELSVGRCGIPETGDCGSGVVLEPLNAGLPLPLPFPFHTTCMGFPFSLCLPLSLPLPLPLNAGLPLPFPLSCPPGMVWVVAVAYDSWSMSAK